MVSIAGIRSGVNDVGERAAASHTGAMATPDVAVQALFDKSGIIRVTSIGSDRCGMRLYRLARSDRRLQGVYSY